MAWNVIEMDWCSSATLPEKLGVGEEEMTAFEDKTFESHAEASSMVEGLENPSSVIAVKALVPKIPTEISKAIDKIRAKLPETKAKLASMLQSDPATGEETWRKALEAEIVARNQNLKVESRSCKGCGSKIATAHIRTFLCPVCLTYPYLQTETDAKAFSAKEEKIGALREEIETVDHRVAELLAEGQKASDDFKRVWLVFRKPELSEQAAS